MTQNLHDPEHFDGTPVTQETARLILKIWRIRAERAGIAHYRTAERNKFWSRILTTVNAGMSILVLFFANASWIRVTFQNESGLFGRFKLNLLPDNVDLYVVLTSITGAFLVLTTVMQFIFRPEHAISQHKAAGAGYAGLVRKMERYQSAETIKMSMLHNLSRECSFLSRLYPMAPAKDFDNKACIDMLQEIKEMVKELKNRQT